MKIETALKMLQEEYNKAKNLAFVRDPVAYSLYQVWKKADAEKERRDGTESARGGAEK